MPEELYDVRQYQKEMIKLYEDRASKFLTTGYGSYQGERQVNGSVAQLILGGAGLDDTARERTTRTGDLVADPAERNRILVNLKELYKSNTFTDFDEFASQGSTRDLFYDAVTSVINRSVDDTAITTLGTATTTIGGALQPMTLDLALEARTRLSNNKVDVSSGKVFAALCPRAMSDLMRLPEFSSADYVTYKPFEGMPSIQVHKWMGVNWFESTRLSGVGTDTATNFMWHRDAFAMVHNGMPKITAGYEGRHQRSYVTATIYIGAEIVQNNGIIKITTKG